MLTRPLYLAFYLLGTEVFVVKVGTMPDPTPETSRPGGGDGGNRELGFGIQSWDVVVEERRPC